MTIEYKDSKRIVTSPASVSYWDFDGTNDYVQMPTIPTGYTFAVSMWLRKDSSGRMAFMVDNDTNGIWLEDANAGSVRLRVGHSQSGSDFDTSTAFPEDDNFHHLVFNVGTPNQIWLDGVSLGTGGSANSSSTNWIPAMGARKSSSTTDRFLDGAMSKVGIWDRKLTDAEVASLYAEAEPSTISSGLLATYNFEQSGNTLEDQTNSYDGTNNGATTGGTRDVPETKPTDIQDNSLLIEKDTANRYWFTAQTGDTPTFEDDYDYTTQTLADAAWIPTDTAKIRVNITNDNLAYTAVNDGSNDLVTHDLGASVSENKWVLRWKQTISTLTDGGTNQSRFIIGLGDTITGAATNQDFIGMFIGWFNTSAHKHYYTNWANGGRGDTANSTEISLVPVTGTKYYELIRTSASTFEFSISSTSAYTKDVLATQTTTGVTATGLRYIKMFNREGGSGGAQIIGTVDDLYFYNDVTSVTSITPATWTWGNPKSIGRGIFASGINSGGTGVNTIDYITVATTGNATDFGDSLKTAHDGSATGSILKAVFGGGAGSTTDSRLEYISFQTLGNATAFGAMSSIGGNSAACGDGSRGIWGQNTAMEYITIDTPATSISFGTLGNNHGSDPASCADSTRGVWGGGEPSADTNAMSYVTIQTLGNSTDFGDLTVARRQFASCANATRGVWGGGYNGSYLNTLDYATIQTPSNATDFGDLTQARVCPSASLSDATRGVWAGGGSPSATHNIIDYITIDTTGNATDFGDLTVARNRTSGASDYVK
jgi:hypothetical protein